MSTCNCSQWPYIAAFSRRFLMLLLVCSSFIYFLFASSWVSQLKDAPLKTYKIIADRKIVANKVLFLPFYHRLLIFTYFFCSFPCYLFSGERRLEICGDGTWSIIFMDFHTGRSRRNSWNNFTSANIIRRSNSDRSKVQRIRAGRVARKQMWPVNRACKQAGKHHRFYLTGSKDE